jgi:hypothetical protein
MRQQHEFDLGWEGRRCLVTDLGAMQARQVARRVTNVIGTAVREAGSASLDREAQIAGIIATGAVLERLDDATLEWLTQTFSKATLIERDPGTEQWLAPKDVVDLAFGGGEGLARWLKWIAFCLEITCADFFRAAFAEFMRIQAKAKVPLSSPTSPSANGAQTRSPNTSETPGTFTESP